LRKDASCSQGRWPKIYIHSNAASSTSLDLTIVFGAAGNLRNHALFERQNSWTNSMEYFPTLTKQGIAINRFPDGLVAADLSHIVSVASTDPRHVAGARSDCATNHSSLCCHIFLRDITITARPTTSGKHAPEPCALGPKSL
jgi:hypothetical protein